MANSIARQPWRLGAILLLLAAFVAGLLIVQISMSGSAETAVDEGPIVEQAGTIDAEDPSVRPQVAVSGSTADPAGSSYPGLDGLTADPGSAFYVSFADSTGASGETGGSMPPAGQPTGPGSLTGTVVEASNPAGSPIPRITVYLARADGVFTGATAMTGDDGRFHFAGLAPGLYKLYFFDLTGVWTAAWYGGPAAPAGTAVSVVSGREAQVVQGLSRADPEDGAIAGRVTDAAGNGIAGVDVLAYFVDEASGVHLLLKGSTVTGADGSYEITGLPAAPSASPGGASHVTGYKIQFAPSGGTYSSQWYDGQPTHLTAKLMQLKPAEKLGGVDAVLTGGGTISGRITLEDGGAAPSTLVDIFDASGVIVDTQITAGDGTYQSDMLPAGTYHLRAVPRSSDYSMEWYDNSTDLASSAVIQVTAGNNTGGLDLVLARVAPAPVAAGEPSVGDAESRLPMETALHESGADRVADTSAGNEATDVTEDGETADGETADGETGDGETADGETGDGDAADGTGGGGPDEQAVSENETVDDDFGPTPEL